MAFRVSRCRRMGGRWSSTAGRRPAGHSYIGAAWTSSRRRRFLARRAANSPFFPDGLWVGFFASGTLKKVSLDGRQPVTLCVVLGARHGASWASDDTILFNFGGSNGMWRVAAAGGEAEPLAATTDPDPGVDLRWPDMLPDGSAALITVWASTLNDAQVGVVSQGTGELTPLMWVDREGQEEPVGVTPRTYSAPRVSPDGTQLAFLALDDEDDYLDLSPRAPDVAAADLPSVGRRGSRMDGGWDEGSLLRGRSGRRARCLLEGGGWHR